MFDQAVLKLTAWYTLALLCVSVVFSVVIYQSASQRLGRSADRQLELFGRFSQPPGVNLRELRQEQVRDDQTALIDALVRANLAILILGGAASYLVARRTLAPIQAAHDAQVRFTADASHELRTPLATMKAEIEVALGEKRLTVAAARKVLASSLEEVERLEQLSSQLLALTTAGAPTTFKRVNLTEHLARQLAAIEEKHQVEVHATLAKGVYVKGDAALLQQLVAILAENARKYAGAGNAAIEVILKKTDRQAVLAMTDHGIGIPATDLPHIFDRFYRGKNAKRRGHGLGLALAKEIVRCHSGTIAAASSLGKQTTFTIRIPLA